MNLSFVKNQSNINRSEKVRKVKAISLSWDNSALTQTFWMSQNRILSQTTFLGFRTKANSSVVKNEGWDSKIGQVVPGKVKTIYRNVRAYGTKGQLLYLYLYILKNKSIYKKNKEIGLGVKQQYSGVRKHVFFCPLVPSLIEFSILLLSMLRNLFSTTNIAPLETFDKIFNLSFLSIRNEIRNLVFTNFQLPVFSELNPEFCIEVIS